MHHVALDRAGADDRDLDGDVVEIPRLHPRQHAHLRAALDLKDAERIGLADHLERRFIIVLQGLTRHRHRDPLVLTEQIERAAHAAEHAETEDIDLHEAKMLNILLFPFDDVAIDHRGRLDRDEIVQRIARQDEAAGVLRQMAWGADQLLGELKRECEAWFAGVEVERLYVAVGHAFVGPAPYLAGERGGHVLGQAEHLAHFADRAAGAEAADHRGQRGMIPAIGFVDPLDHFLAPLMLEIDVDVGRFAALLRDEAFEEELVLDRIDRGDAEDEADDRIGRRAAPLAQDLDRAGVADDRVYGEEIRRVAHLRDEREFVFELPGIGAGRLAIEAVGERVARQAFQRFLRAAAGHDDLVGILIVEVAQREGAAFDDRLHRGERIGVSGEAARHFFR